MQPRRHEQNWIALAISQTGLKIKIFGADVVRRASMHRVSVNTVKLVIHGCWGLPLMYPDIKWVGNSAMTQNKK